MHANALRGARSALIVILLGGIPAVAAAADARLDHADLTALLYAQGYSGDEIVRD